MDELGDVPDLNNENSEERKSRVPIQNSIIYLLIHQHRIRNVEEWSTSMGYSRSHFSREMKAFYDESPKKLFRTIKMIHIFMAFSQDSNRKAFAIARDTAFENEKTMGQFLSRNFDMAIKDVRTICDEGSLAFIDPLLEPTTPLLVEYWVRLLQHQQQHLSWFFKKAQIAV